MKDTTVNKMLKNVKHYIDVAVSNLLSFLKIFFACFVLVFLVANFIVRPIHVSGTSMYPTLKDGEIGLSSSFTAKFQDIDRGQIVIVYDNVRTKSNWVKRVIGLPGDTIYCQDDTVYVNGIALAESYLDNDFAQQVYNTGGNISFTDDFGPITLGEDEYWLMGDNRTNSSDSRKVGPFHRKQIKSVGVFVIFPFSKIRLAK